MLENTIKKGLKCHRLFTVFKGFTAMQDLVRTLKDIQDRKIMVIGDLMLDTFVYGDVERISPESPVPVLAVSREDTMLGGAGNVVSSLSALKAKPLLFSVIGDDVKGAEVLSIAKALDADVSGIVVDSSRPTILKTRYLARAQQVLRTDIEKTHPIDTGVEAKMLAAIQKAMKQAQAIVLSDYGKGVLTKELLQKTIQMAAASGIPVLVDPKGIDFSIYRGADIVTPNRKELGGATGAKNLRSDDDIIACGKKIIRECGIKTVVATRSEDGMTIVPSVGAATHFKAQAREVFDVSGAGDTVIATLAAALAAGADIAGAAQLANIAGGIAVSKVGTTPVRSEEILAVLEGHQDGSSLQAPIADWTQAGEQIRKWKAQGLKVGMTGGCFDIIHYGHVNYLNEARRNCDRLVLALNHDASVKILKGPSRPVNDQTARATVIGALASVDMVVFFGASSAGEDNTPVAIVTELKPDIFFKGGDYTVDQLPEAKPVLANGGEVSIMKMHQGYSTTSIIEKSRQSA